MNVKCWRSIICRLAVVVVARVVPRVGVGAWMKKHVGAGVGVRVHVLQVHMRVG